ncbi:uncharacterized protein LOC144559439 [Carex rostrata]
MEHTISKRILHIIQAVYYMLRKGLSKKKLMMDLHLLLQRGKIAGKSLSHLLHPHPHPHNSGNSTSAFSCISVDPNLSVYNPSEVEFSCSNKPNTLPAAFRLPKRSKRNQKQQKLHELNAEAIAKAFEILNSTGEAGANAGMSALATPSPMLALALGQSPAIARQLRVTDSPFPVQEGTPADGVVDQQADEFIKKFYEQLKIQQSIAGTPTPDHVSIRRGRRGSMW